MNGAKRNRKTKKNSSVSRNMIKGYQFDESIVMKTGATTKDT
jgi:hypothetical protein